MKKLVKNALSLLCVISFMLGVSLADSASILPTIVLLVASGAFGWLATYSQKDKS